MQGGEAGRIPFISSFGGALVGRWWGGVFCSSLAAKKAGCRQVFMTAFRISMIFGVFFLFLRSPAPR
ncbi:MAG: hypothetical protein ACI36T_06800 [Eggerthellaceae bacterium]